MPTWSRWAMISWHWRMRTTFRMALVSFPSFPHWPILLCVHQSLVGKMCASAGQCRSVCNMHARSIVLGIEKLKG